MQGTYHNWSLVSLFKKILTSASCHWLCDVLRWVLRWTSVMHWIDISHNDNSKSYVIPCPDISVHGVKVFTEVSVLLLAKIKWETEADPDLKTLKQYINAGFSKNKADYLKSLRGYFNFRKELLYGHCQNKGQNQDKLLLAKPGIIHWSLLVSMLCLCNLWGEATWWFCPYCLWN